MLILLTRPATIDDNDKVKKQHFGMVYTHFGTVEIVYHDSFVAVTGDIGTVVLGKMSTSHSAIVLADLI